MIVAYIMYIMCGSMYIICNSMYIICDSIYIIYVVIGSMLHLTECNRLIGYTTFSRIKIIFITVKFIILLLSYNILLLSSFLNSIVKSLFLFC